MSASARYALGNPTTARTRSRPEKASAALLLVALLGGMTAIACGGRKASSLDTPCHDVVATGSPGLVDDLNDGDNEIPNNDGRQGVWYTYNDGTAGTQTPAAPNADVCTVPPPPFTPTNGQACTSGSGFTSWGAGMGVTISTGSEACVSCRYDASVYKGVRFTISGSGISDVRFMVITLDTLYVRYGGKCADESRCTNSYGMNVAVTEQPRVVEIPWTSLAQESWGTPVLFNVREVTHLVWQVPGRTNFSLCVDDVSLY
jgi:hypothetical protein